MEKENSKKEFNFNLWPQEQDGEGKPHVIVIREGEAEKIIYPESINVKAALSAPGIFIKHLRTHNLLRPENHLIFIDVEKRGIIFKEDATSVYGANITGLLQIDKRLEKLGINTAKRYTREELYSFVRLNRHIFPDKDAHLKLQAAIKNFEMNVTKDFKSGNDNRGSKTSVNNQELNNTNMPFDFTIKTSVFAGYPSFSFIIEVMLDLSDGGIRFWLESPDLASFIEEKTIELIETEVNENFKGLTIFYE